MDGVEDKTMNSNKPTHSRLLKAAEVAEILNISRAMAYKLMQTKEIPTVCIGRSRRVRPFDLHNYIATNQTSRNS